MAAEPEQAQARAQSSLSRRAVRSDEVVAALSRTAAWVSRPRVRLTLSGILLLLIGGLILTNSVWTLPLVIVGALMVAVAWVGHRLEGRFVVEWGKAGTELAFRATLKAAHEIPVGQPETRPAAAQTSQPVPATDEVIEGEAHTVEIDVAELKALIAAAEAQERGEAPGGEAEVQDIRIRRLEHDSSRATQPSR
jgi:hypothetical protein